MHDPVDLNLRIVSVVIPAFNAAIHLRETVMAALASDRVAKVIVIDDGSTDDTAALLRSLQRNNQSLCVLTQTNQGVSAARNAGFRVVSTAFTCFVDADDILLPGGLTELLDLLVTDPTAAASYGRVDYIDRQSQPLKLGSARSDDRVIRLEHVLQASFVDTLGAVLCRTEAIVACGQFDQSLRYAEDWEFLTRLALFGPFLPLNRSVLAYRQHAESAMSSEWLGLHTLEPAIRLVFSSHAPAADRFDRPTLKRFERRRRAGDLRRLGHRRQSVASHLRILAVFLMTLANSGCDRVILDLFARAILTSGKRIVLRA